MTIDSDNWRDGLLKVMLRVSVFLGALVYVPSVYVAIRAGLFEVVAIDTIALALVVGLLVVPQIPYRVRAVALCAIYYALGAGLLIWVGSVSQIYLFGFSIAAAMLLGLRAGLIAAAVSSVTMVVIGAVGLMAPEMFLPNWSHDFPSWVVVTLNFALVNTLLTMAIGTVISAINRALQREIAARTSLDAERKLLRTLLDTLPDAVFTKDMQGRYVNANAASIALVGLEREEQMVGKTDFDFFLDRQSQLDAAPPQA